MAFGVGPMEPLEVYLCPFEVWSLDPFQPLPRGSHRKFQEPLPIEAPIESYAPRSINPWRYEGLDLFTVHFSDPHPLAQVSGSP